MIKILQTKQFQKWFKRLRDRLAKDRILARLTRIKETGNLGNYKPITEDIYELKIPYGGGYRIYFTKQEDVIILLVFGGDKSSQKEILRKRLRF